MAEYVIIICMTIINHKSSYAYEYSYLDGGVPRH